MASGSSLARPARLAGQRSGETFLLHLFVRNVWRPLLSYLGDRNLMARAQDAPPPWIDPAYLRRMELASRSVRRIAPRSRGVGQQYLAERIAATGYTAQGVYEPVSETLEVRHPLLYRPLVEFMMGIPWDQKFRPGQDRFLQRRALRGILPERVRQRQDKSGPDEALFEGLRTVDGRSFSLTDPASSSAAMSMETYGVRRSARPGMDACPR